MQTKSKDNKKDQNKKYFNGSRLKAGIVVARWNSEITKELLKDALADLKKCKMKLKNIRIVHVSGAVEIPYALHKLAKLNKSKKFDFLVALGCIIRGETPLFDYDCKLTQEGILKVMIEDNIPVGFGILTVNNLKQAKERFHVGGEATLAALELGLLK